MPAAARSSAADKFGFSEEVAVAEDACRFTLFVSVKVVEAAPDRTTSMSNSKRDLVGHVIRRRRWCSCRRP